LRDNGFTVEEIPFAEISKQEGLCAMLHFAVDYGLHLYVSRAALP